MAIKSYCSFSLPFCIVYPTIKCCKLLSNFTTFLLFLLLIALVPPLTGASSSCEFTEFACADGQQCIPKSYQCDTQFDCLDQSDEIGCGKTMV